MVNSTNNELIEKFENIFKYSVENSILATFYINSNGLIIYSNKSASEY